MSNILDEIDIYVTSKLVKEHGPGLYDDKDFNKHLTTRTIRRVLEIRESGQEQDVHGLVQVVLADRIGVYPAKYSSRLSNWEAIEAAKELARYPDRVIPLLRDEMKGNVEDKIIYYALALCGTDKAVGIIEHATRTVKNSWAQQSVKYALGIVGGPFRSEADEGVFFPALPEHARLPQNLAEIDEDVAYEQSLPKSVAVDLSSPASSVQTFFMSLIIGDRRAYDQCTALEQTKWADQYDSMVQDVQEERFKSSLSEIQYMSDDRAEVTVDIASGNRAEAIVLILRKSNNGWLVSDLKEDR